MKLYRDFATQEEIDAHYNPLATVAGPGSHHPGLGRAGAAVARLGMRAGGQVRAHPRRILRRLPRRAAPPVHVFVHGGYWRRFSAATTPSWPALVAAGITTVVMNYALCPSVGLDEIVRQTRAAIAWAFTTRPSSAPTRRG